MKWNIYLPRLFHQPASTTHEFVLDMACTREVHGDASIDNDNMPAARLRLLSTSNFRFFFLTHLLTYETLWSWLVWYITFICIIIDVWGHESVARHNRTILTTSEEGHLEHSQITGLRHVPMRRPGWLTYTNTKLSWWTIAPGYWLLLKQCDIIYVAITAWCHEDTAIKRGKQMWHGLVQRLGWLMYTNMKL